MKVYYDSLLGSANNVSATAFVDSRGITVPSGVTNPFYPLYMSSGQAIEFDAPNTLNAAPVRTLKYTGILLSYLNAATTEFSIDDSGNGVFNGSVTSTSYKWPSGSLSFYQPTSTAEFLRMTDSGGALASYFALSYNSGLNALSIIPGGSAANLFLGGSGGGNIILGTAIRLEGYTVATLPSCATGTKGLLAFVTDANAPTWLGTLTGSSTTHVPVFCNGTAWVAG